MHELLMDRVAELHAHYDDPDTLALSATTENGRKYLFRMDEASNPEKYSNQGGFVWHVLYRRNDGRINQYGPMDSRELKMMHPELFWKEA